MADIDSLKKINGPKKRKKSERSASPQTVTTPNLTPLQWDIIKYVLGGITIVLFVALVQAVAAYVQLAQNAYQQYSDTLMEYHNDRYRDLESRVDKLEIKLTATSAAEPVSY